MEKDRNPSIPPTGGFLARLAGMATPHGRPIARLWHVDGRVSIEGARPVELWGRGGHLGPEFGETGLPAALSLPDNAWLLRAMAGLPVDGPIPSFLGRELGGGVDVAAAFGPRLPRLLLVDVMGLEPPRHEEWLAHARRIAVATLPSLHLDPTPEVRLVTLGGWHDRRDGEDQGTLHDSMGRSSIAFEAWGFLPFALPRPRAGEAVPGERVPATEWDVHVLFGPAARMRQCEAVAALRERLAGGEAFALGWASPERSLTLSGGREWAELRVRGHRHFVRAAVRVKPEAHRKSYHPEPDDPVARRIAELRALSHGAGLPGWLFRGEHHDQGCARFEWEPASGDGSEARALDLLERFRRALEEALPERGR